MALLACFVGAIPSLTASAQPAPTFLVERITVEGVSHGQARIVAAESLLTEGASYDERELRDAVHRVKRLPFVLLADFSLRKGSVRGSYELVIAVAATRWFFSTAELSVMTGGDFPSYHGLTGSGGVRQTVGSSGEVFGQLSGTSYSNANGWSPSFQVGYNQYNLFGRGAVASMLYSRVEPQYDASSSAPGSSGHSDQVSVELTFPVAGGNNAIRLGVSTTKLDTTLHLAPFEQSMSGSSTGGFLGWTYNDVDDPVSPRLGQIVEATVSFADVSQQGVFAFQGGWPGSDGLPPYDEHVKRRGLLLSFNRYWSIGERQSWSVSSSLSATRTDGAHALVVPPGTVLTGTQYFQTASIGAGYAAELFPQVWTQAMSRLRFETGATIHFFRVEETYFAGSPAEQEWNCDLRTGLVYRNPWGVYRMTISYLLRGNRLPE